MNRNFTILLVLLVSVPVLREENLSFRAKQELITVVDLGSLSTHLSFSFSNLAHILFVIELPGLSLNFAEEAILIWALPMTQNNLLLKVHRI